MIVTGGIGRGLVLEFARKGANVVNVVNVDIDSGETLQDETRRQGLSGKVLPLVADISRRADVDALIARVHAEFGPVDALTNNAGGSTAPGPFETLTRADRDWQMALNLDGVINSTQAVAGDMLSRGKGSIINISSNAAQLGVAADNMVHYASVKGWLNSFSKALAYEWGPKGVRVNNISPGWIVPMRTSMSAPAVSGAATALT
ncbi:MAG: short-chain dehydrogenase [Rhodospirillales bacterium]|nr:short-chain dehydrogenase [Rhodospirillales bacterium]